MMRSDALDIIIEGRGRSTWLFLAGPFHKEQIPNIRAKFSSLLEDGNRDFIVDLEGLTSIDPGIAEMFLFVTNDARAKGGEIRFIFKNPMVDGAFSPYQNLLLIFPDADALTAGGLFRRMLRRGKILSRKTGVRLSRPVAVFMLIVLCGWFLTLIFIIHLQSIRLGEEQKELTELTQWKKRSTMEMTVLKERLRPLEQLGIVHDTMK